MVCASGTAKTQRAALSVGGAATRSAAPTALPDRQRNHHPGEGQLADPVRVYTEGVSLFRQLQREKEKLSLGDDFEVIDGFTIFSKPSSPGLLKGSVIAVGVWLALAYGLILLLEVNKYLSRIEKERFDS